MFKRYDNKLSGIGNELKVEKFSSSESKEDRKSDNGESSNYSIISIEFKEIKSKYFQDAVNLIKNLPNYNYDVLEEKHSFRINEIKDYAKNYLLIENLIKFVSRWKSSLITAFVNKKVYHLAN